jgi:polyisoprenoid-binding protein YceI
MKWTLDNAHTTVGVAAKHLMLTTVRGRFSGVRGEIDFDPKVPLRAKAWLEIDAASVDTGDAKRDAHLRSADFLDVEHHPTIRFESTSIRREAGPFLVTGDLTIRGTTKPVAVKVEVSDVLDDPWGGKRVAFEATSKIDRRDWGLVWNMPLANGGVLVSNDLTIEVSIQAVPAKGAPQDELTETVAEAEEAHTA